MADMSRLLKSKHVEDGFAIALKYLQEEFHDCQVDVIDPDGPEGDPDRDIRQGGPSRSALVHCPDTQRILFDIELLRNLATPQSTWGLHTLHQWGVADFIRGAKDAVRVTTHGPKEARVVRRGRPR